MVASDEVGMPSVHPRFPGEMNKYAQPDAELCVEFNLTGR